MRRRTHLTYVTVLWLASQVAAFTASSLAVCCDHDGSAKSERHSCCAGMKPGQACPLHRQAERRATVADSPQSDSASHQHDGGTAAVPDRTSPHGDVPALECACCASNTPLATVLLGHGILPPEFVLPYAPVVKPVGDADTGPTARSGRPDLPPPRA